MPDHSPLPPQDPINLASSAAREPATSDPAAKARVRARARVSSNASPSTKSPSPKPRAVVNADPATLRGTMATKLKKPPKKPPLKRSSRNRH